VSLLYEITRTWHPQRGQRGLLERTNSKLITKEGGGLSHLKRLG
jgi:hypothetical protein